MKKILLTLAVAGMAFVADAQSKFEVKDFGKFKLHTYITADPLGDMSYIVEGNKGLVVLEPAAFRDNIKEMQQHVAGLGKPVEKVIADYHAAGFSTYEPSQYVMVEGMPEFVKGDIYRGMVKGFAANFGDAIDSEGNVPTATVARNGKERFAGVEFVFTPGAASDFPAASILIGSKIYYLHFTPVAGMHMGPLQLTGRAAVEAYLSELERANASGAELFIGGHGMATADKSAVDFQIGYLKKVQETMNGKKNAEDFIAAMKSAYPYAAASENLTAVAANLYK